MNCLSSAKKDLNILGFRNKKILEKLISDNYTILCIFFIVLLTCLIIMYYYGSNIRKTLRDYYKYSASAKLHATSSDNQYDDTADNEVYQNVSDKLEKDVGFRKFDVVNQAEEHIRQTKKEFMEDIRKRYEEYNTLKSDYILGTYSRVNDDVIDDKILYNKYDDYSYKKSEDY